MQSLEYGGSTSEFFRIGTGVIVKQPRQVWKENPNHKDLEDRFARAIDIERQILESLGSYKRIVPYYGAYQSSGIQLAEANHGDLQTFIDKNSSTIDSPLRWKWTLQVAEAVVYAHQMGVIHSDLRPENFLVHSATLDLWLCDFGGSMCKKLGLDGGNLPDDPFFDPRMPWETTPATDIFSLGSIIYTILTGHWPHRNGPAPVGLEKFAFQQEVNKLFEAGKFPDVSGIGGGEVIKGCWDYKYRTAKELLNAIKEVMAAQGLKQRID